MPHETGPIHAASTWGSKDGERQGRKGTEMLLVFKKRRTGGVGQQPDCDIAIGISPYRKDGASDCMAIRIAWHVLKAAGWQIGDRCIPQYDGERWTLVRTTNVQDGYAISRSTTSKSKAGNVKLSLCRDHQVQLGMRRGDRQRCSVVEANGEQIVAVPQR
jgi:hypothetical protein